LQFARAAPLAPSGLSLHIGGMGFSPEFTLAAVKMKKNPLRAAPKKAVLMRK